SPSEVKVVIEIEDVATVVKGDKEPVPVVRPPVDLGVHIVEMHEVTLARHPQECVDIRSACRHNKRTLVPDNGPFNGYSAGQRTDSSRDGERLVVTVFRPDFENGRQATAEPGRDTPLVKFRILDYIGIKDRK